MTIKRVKLEKPVCLKTEGQMKDNKGQRCCPCCKSRVNGLNNCCGSSCLAERQPFNAHKFCLFAVLTVFCLWSGFLATRSWRRWAEKEITVVEENRLKPVSEIPFPAVTVCSPVLVDLGKLDVSRLEEEWRALSEVARTSADGPTAARRNKMEDQMAALARMCGAGKLTRELEASLGLNFSRYREPTYTPKYRALDYQYPTTFLKEWKADLVIEAKSSYDTEGKLDLVPTSQGLCYTFNNLEFEKTWDWDIEGGYRTEGKGLPERGGRVSEAAHPHRVPGAASRGWLRLKLRPLSPLWTSSCQTRGFSIKIFVHSPQETPTGIEKFKQIDHNDGVELLVRPNLITTSSELRAYGVDERQCLFSDEGKLFYYKIYTQLNCRKECFTNYTLSTQHCAHFLLPKPNASVPICKGPFTWYLYDDLLALEEVIEKGVLPPICRCLPPCNSLDYQVVEEVLYQQVADPFIVVAFSTPLFSFKKRINSYDYLDFIAYCGLQLGSLVGLLLLGLWEMSGCLTASCRQGRAPDPETSARVEQEKATLSTIY